MYRSKDFLMMNVIDVKGKKLGYISDFSLNIQENKLEGFIISSNNLISKKNLTVKIENILYYNKDMIVSETSGDIKLKFSSIKGLDVIDLRGNNMGMIEDFLIDKTLHIKAYIITEGFFHKLFRGKKIVLSKKMILGDNNMLNYDECSYTMQSLRHKLAGVESHE